MFVASIKLLRLLVSLNEELASLLTVDLEEVGVEVSGVDGQGLVAPRFRGLVVDGANEPFF